MWLIGCSPSAFFQWFGWSSKPRPKKEKKKSRAFWKNSSGIVHAGSQINFQTTFPDTFLKVSSRTRFQVLLYLISKWQYCVCVEWIHLSPNFIKTFSRSFPNSLLEKWVWESGLKIDAATSVISQCPYKFSSFLDLSNASNKFRLFSRDVRLFRLFFPGSAMILHILVNCKFKLNKNHNLNVYREILLHSNPIKISIWLYDDDCFYYFQK